MSGSRARSALQRPAEKPRDARSEVTTCGFGDWNVPLVLVGAAVSGVQVRQTGGRRRDLEVRRWRQWPWSSHLLRSVNKRERNEIRQLDKKMNGAKWFFVLFLIFSFWKDTSVVFFSP